MPKEVENNNVKEMLVNIIFGFSELNIEILPEEQNQTRGLIQEQSISKDQIVNFLNRMISYSPLDLDIGTSSTLNEMSSKLKIAQQSFESGNSQDNIRLRINNNTLLRINVGLWGLFAVGLAGCMLMYGHDAPWIMDLMWIGIAMFGTALVNVKLYDNVSSLVGFLSAIGPAVVGGASALKLGGGNIADQTLKESMNNPSEELKKLFEAVDGIIKCDSTNDFKLIFTQGCRLLDQTPRFDTDEKCRKIFISGILNTLEQKVDNNESLDDNQKQKYKEVIALGKDNIDQIGSKTKGFKLCEELKRIDRDAIGSQPGI